MTVTQIKPDFAYLKERWSEYHADIQTSFWEKHGESLQWLDTTSKNLLLTSMTGLVLLSHPAVSPIYAERLLPAADTNTVVSKPARTTDQLISDLKPYLPGPADPLSPNQEQEIGQKLSEYFDMTVRAELEGKRLNRSYGIIGAEQHLMRYPGDTMESHFATQDEARYWSSGMAPGRGAWGYFTSSREAMTQQDVDREKYYIAAQTFLSPGWNENVNEMYRFFKYRKMLLVNAENGKAIVAVIGDAGPAEWTGKHLGGSPEVMAHLERVDGGAKGPVLYFFIDDPEDTIPLGPITISN